MKVERTEIGPHPLDAGGRTWEKPGEVGEMVDEEAVVRIAHGYFRPAPQEKTVSSSHAEPDPES